MIKKNRNNIIKLLGYMFIPTVFFIIDTLYQSNTDNEILRISGFVFGLALIFQMLLTAIFIMVEIADESAERTAKKHKENYKTTILRGKSYGKNL